MNCGLGGKRGRWHSAGGWLVLLLCFSTAFAAMCEEGGSEYHYRDHGYRVGPLSFSPGARMEMVYSDNVLNSPTDRRDDLLTVYSPTMSLKLRPSDLATLSFTYTPRWNDYLKNEIDDYFTHNATAALNMPRLIATDFNLSLNASYNEAQNTGLLEDEIIRLQKYANLEYGISGAYRMAHGSVSASFKRSSLMYQNETLSGSSVETQSTDFQITRSIHSRKLQLVLSYDINQTLPNESAPPPPENTDPKEDPGQGNVLSVNSPVGSDTHTLTLGLKGSVGRFTYSVLAGATSPQIIYEGSSPVNPVTEAQLQFVPNDKLQLSILVSRGQSTDARTGRSFKRTAEGAPEILNEGDTGTSQNIGFYASARYRLNSRIKTDLEIGRYSVTGIRTGASTDTRASAGATILLGVRGTMDAGVSRTNSERFQGTRVTQQYNLGFGWKFSDFATAAIKLDRTEDHTTNDPESGQPNKLDTIANTVQIGLSFTW